VLGIGDAEHAEDSPGASTLLITPVACPVPIRAPGAPALSGSLAIELLEDTLVRRIHNEPRVLEEYYCNFELNPEYRAAIEAAGLIVSGVGGQGEAKVVELTGHPFFVGTLYQPQRASQAGRPHPILVAFVAAAAEFGAARGD
jgi:CTP synthase (UTP-ammonia lyase)